MATLPDISIIGPGKVGTAIGILAVRSGLSVVAVAGRDRQRAQEAARAMGADVAVTTPGEAAAAGQLVLLTVSDEAIQQVCGELAAAKAFRKGAVVAHCSGVLGSEILTAARRHCRCLIGSMHPLHTFPSARAAAESFAGSYCFCEGDSGAVEVLERLARAIGGKAVRIGPGRKALYHASAVMACNYVVALLAAAGELAEAAGIDRQTALDAFSPIVRATARNVAGDGPAEALTGPIARGDADTVSRHLQALATCPARLRETYRTMGKLTVDLALQKGSIDASKAHDLRRLLENDNKKE